MLFYSKVRKSICYNTVRITLTLTWSLWFHQHPFPPGTPCSYVIHPPLIVKWFEPEPGRGEQDNIWLLQLQSGRTGRPTCSFFIFPLSYWTLIASMPTGSQHRGLSFRASSSPGRSSFVFTQSNGNSRDMLLCTHMLRLKQAHNRTNAQVLWPAVKINISLCVTPAWSGRRGL